jgi:hypothetical protein
MVIREQILPKADNDMPSYRIFRPAQTAAASSTLKITRPFQQEALFITEGDQGVNAGGAVRGNQASGRTYGHNDDHHSSERPRVRG